MSDIQNTAQLREILLNEIEAVRSGKSDHKKAQAISKLSAEILRSAKMDLDVLKFNVANGEAAKAGDRVLQLVNK